MHVRSGLLGVQLLHALANHRSTKHGISCQIMDKSEKKAYFTRLDIFLGAFPARLICRRAAQNFNTDYIRNEMSEPAL